MSELFCEVLTEEIPAWMLEPRLEVLRERLGELAGEYGAGEARIEADATSRRIWFTVSGLEAKQTDRNETIKGPPEKVAFDPEGNPTKALEGFLRKSGVGEGGYERRDGYLWVEQQVPGKTIEEFFASQLPNLIEKLRWPKMMRWDGGEWIRPIHSVIALVDGERVDFSVFGVPTGTTTEGHRTRSKGSIEVTSFPQYEKSLREAEVVVRSGERVSMLEESARDLAAEVDGEPVEDAGIWSQWKFLTEYPGLVRAEFSDQYLELPHEVLVTVMRVHQKQLPIVKDGSLTSSFLAVMDGADDPDGFAASGNAFVTNARFADALFFYRNDMRTRMVDRVKTLESLQFQEKLGDYKSKTERMVAIARKIAASAGSQIDGKKLELSVNISKVDLQTEMVRELTELQGVMGGVYAREEGIDELVWQAVYDQYKPQAVDDELPRSELGAILSLADRIDTLAGFFLIGLEPTGSRDPFALRRAAQGIVRILFNEKGWSIPITVDRLVDVGLEAHAGIESEDRGAVRGKLIEFLGDRVKTILESVHGFGYDEVDATMSSGWSEDLRDLIARTGALARIRHQNDFLSILDSAKRIANITPEGFEGELDPGRFEEDSEQRLFQLGELVGSQIAELVAVRDYGSAFESFAGMASELEQFFTDVLVNVEDEAIRNNRIALLQFVGSLVSSIADVTRIVVDRKAMSRE